MPSSSSSSSEEKEKSLVLLEKLFKRIPHKRWLLLPKDELEARARNSLCRALQPDLKTIQQLLLTAGIFQKKKKTKIKITKNGERSSRTTTIIELCEPSVIDRLNERFRKHKILFQTASVALRRDGSERRLVLFVIRVKPTTTTTTTKRTNNKEPNPPTTTTTMSDTDNGSTPPVRRALTRSKTGPASDRRKIRPDTTKETASIARWYGRSSNTATHNRRSPPTPETTAAISRSHHSRRHHETARKETFVAKSNSSAIPAATLPPHPRAQRRQRQRHQQQQQQQPQQQRRISFSGMVSVIRGDDQSVDLQAEATKIETILNEDSE